MPVILSHLNFLASLGMLTDRSKSRKEEAYVLRRKPEPSFKLIRGSQRYIDPNTARA